MTMFDLKTLAVIKQIKVGPGLDGIMYDEPDDKIISPTTAARSAR